MKEPRLMNVRARLTQEEYACLVEAAEKNCRSLSKEISYRLRLTFDEDRKITKYLGKGFPLNAV